jgi:hypothetical protein
MPVPIFESTPDTNLLSLDLAVLLFDGYTGGSQLFGNPSVLLAGLPSAPYQKAPLSTYLFFGVRPGSYTVQVRSSDVAPCYLGVDIQVTLPMPNPLWPAFPDVTLADQSKPLDDPTQPTAYLAQRDLAALKPTTSYPFPANATLIRGTVTSGGTLLLGSLVQHLGADESYLTGAEGQFVLALERPVGLKGTIAVRASHPIHPDVDVTVAVDRGTTTAVNIDMGP